MTITASYIPADGQTDQQANARAQALGIGVAPRQIPPAYQPFVTTLPGVVAEYGQSNVVYLPDTGTLTAAQVTAGIAPLVAAEQAAQTTSANQQTVQQLAAAGLVANRNDQTQDATIQTGAATISGTAGTFTLAQCTTFIKQLAQAVNTLAGNDVNAKRELNLLIRLLLQQFDGTN